jgi:periplasmic mercuric ion binding protein
MMKALGLLVGVAATAGVLSLCPLCGAGTTSDHLVAATFAPAVSSVASVPESSVVTLEITGMTCGGCVLGVRKVLTRLDGVTKAVVSYEKGTAVVTFDPSKTDAEQMITAIKTLGYTAVVAT